MFTRHNVAAVPSVVAESYVNIGLGCKLLHLFRPMNRCIVPEDHTFDFWSKLLSNHQEHFTHVLRSEIVLTVVIVQVAKSCGDEAAYVDLRHRWAEAPHFLHWLARFHPMPIGIPVRVKQRFIGHDDLVSLINVELQLLP